MNFTRKEEPEKEKGRTENAPKSKIHWRCCVPGCESRKSILRHAFPKDSALSRSWRERIKNAELDNLTSEELRNYRVCQLHFSEDVYTLTSVRRVLRNDAVPTLLLERSSSVDNVEEKSVDAGKTEKEHTAKDKEYDVLMTKEDLNAPSTSAHYVPELSPQAERAQVNACSTPKTSRKRPLLGSITRKNKLTPVVSRLHGIAEGLLKRQSRFVHKLSSYRARVESAEKYSKGVEMRELKSLSKEQLAFVEMQIRNVHKKAKGVYSNPERKFPNNCMFFTDSSRTGTRMDNSRLLMKLVQSLKSKGCCDCIASLLNFQNFESLLNEAHCNLEGNIPFFSFKKDVVKNLKMSLVLLLDFSFVTCKIHAESVIQELTRLIAVEYVISWCKFMNLLLKGKDSGATAAAYLSKQAITQYKKKLQKKNR